MSTKEFTLTLCYVKVFFFSGSVKLLFLDYTFSGTSANSSICLQFYLTDYVLYMGI